jgi:hypothetical protein
MRGLLLLSIDFVYHILIFGAELIKLYHNYNKMSKILNRYTSFKNSCFGGGGLQSPLRSANKELLYLERTVTRQTCIP